MKFKCDIKIMGVPTRIQNSTRLCLKLGLVMDDVILDRKMERNAAKTSRRAFTKPIPRGITHRCVLQDDIDVCEGFDFLIQNLVNRYPNAIFSLYSRKRERDEIPYASIIKTGGRIWGQAVIIPIKFLDTIYKKYDDGYDDYHHDDGFYSRMARHMKMLVLTTYPSSIKLLDVKSELKHTIPVDNRSYGEIGQMELEDNVNLSLNWPEISGLKF